MQLSEVINISDLKQAIEDGFVNISRHPSAPLTIHNYSAQTQFAQRWDDVTETCRGLIVADDGEIVARPFRKFQNYGQTAIPNHAKGSPPAVFEKMDGSLGVSYEIDGKTFVATRGSFNSDQALWASTWLATNFPDFRSPPGVTTLFEIIYPGNRIVVDYGSFEGLVLLGAVNIKTGADIPLWEIDWWDGERAGHHPDIREIQDAHLFANARDRENLEGVVLVWYRPGTPSFRLKCKGVEYLRLHKLITNCSSKTIWEALRSGESLLKLIEDVPDEFHAWVETTVHELQDAYLGIYVNAQTAFEEIVDVVGEKIGDELIVPDSKRKDFAMRAQKWAHPGLLFSILDGKSIDEAVWKLVKPDYERPFWTGVAEEV